MLAASTRNFLRAETSIVATVRHKKLVKYEFETETKAKKIPITHEIHNIIKWRRPERLPAWDPRKSCDLRRLPSLDPNTLKLEYQPFEEMIRALPEAHQKVFTVDYAPRREGIKIIMQDTFKRVRRHKYDGTKDVERSYEHLIAWFTIKIRDIRENVELKESYKNNGMFKRQAKEFVDKRKKYLNKLRHVDYKRFEWLIEVLGIMFKPNGKFVRTYRKESICMLTDMLCQDIIGKKIEAYKAELEAEKIPFLEDKLRILEEIRDDELEMNLTPSVTVEIEETVKRLEKLKKTEQVIHPIAEEVISSDTPLST